MRDYEPGTVPTPAQVRQAQETAGLTDKQSAELIYCSLRGWTGWKAETCAEQYKRRMHPAVFELYLIKTGQKRLAVDR